MPISLQLCSRPFCLSAIASILADSARMLDILFRRAYCDGSSVIEIRDDASGRYNFEESPAITEKRSTPNSAAMRRIADGAPALRRRRAFDA